MKIDRKTFKWLIPAVAVALGLILAIGLIADSEDQERRVYSAPLASGADRDGDGFRRQEDCNDADPSVYPGAPDTPGDGIDQDCDGEDALVDNDGDGYGYPSSGPLDCDDSDPSVYPDAPGDTRGDGIDQDCDGEDG